MDGNNTKYLDPEYFERLYYKKKKHGKLLLFMNNRLFAKLLAFFGGVYLFFYLKRPFRDYKIVLVKDEVLLNEVYKFRYKIYCLTDKLLNKENYLEKKEYDKYDKNSFEFAVLNNFDEVVGTFRLIKNSSIGFPTEDEFNLDPIVGPIRSSTVEISRLMVEKDYRKTMLLLDILKTILQFSKANSINYWYGCAETWFIRTLNKIIGPLLIIDKKKQCFNAINYPFLLSVNILEQNVKNKSKLMYYFFQYRSNNISF